jgi:hypothetical protein
MLITRNQTAGTIQIEKSITQRWATYLKDFTRIIKIAHRLDYAILKLI